MAVYTTPLWKWELSSWMPIEMVRCAFCKGELARWHSLSDPFDYSVGCPPCGLKFSIDVLRESIREGGLRLYSDWPKEKSMKPADLLQDLEVGDRVKEQLFPDDKKDPLVEQVAALMGGGDFFNATTASELAAMAGHVREHQRRMEFEQAERVRRDRQAMLDQMTRPQNIVMDPGIGMSRRRGWFGGR